MKGLFYFVLFLFGAFAMNIDNLFFEFVSGVWYGLMAFNFIVYIVMIPKDSIRRFILLAERKNRPLPINTMLLLTLVKWCFAFIFGHIYMAPVMLLVEFLCYYRIKINLPKHLASGKI